MKRNLDPSCDHCLHDRIAPVNVSVPAGTQYVYCCLCDGAGFVNPQEQKPE